MVARNKRVSVTATFPSQSQMFYIDLLAINLFSGDFVGLFFCDGGGGVGGLWFITEINTDFIVFSMAGNFITELTAVSTDAAKTIRVCRVVPVGRFVNPPPL